MPPPRWHPHHGKLSYYLNEKPHNFRVNLNRCIPTRPVPDGGLVTRRRASYKKRGFLRSSFSGNQSQDPCYSVPVKRKVSAWAVISNRAPFPGIPVSRISIPVMPKSSGISIIRSRYGGNTHAEKWLPCILPVPPAIILADDFQIIPGRFTGEFNRRNGPAVTEGILKERVKDLLKERIRIQFEIVECHDNRYRRERQSVPQQKR